MLSKKRAPRFEMEHVCRVSNISGSWHARVPHSEVGIYCVNISSPSHHHSGDTRQTRNRRSRWVPARKKPPARRGRARSETG